MASSSSEAAPPVAAGEDPAAPAKGQERTKKEKTRVVLPQFHLDTLMRAEEFLEPLPPPDEEFLAQVREQRGQKGFVEIDLTDDEEEDEEEEEKEGGNAAPPAGGRGSMEEDKFSPEVTKKHSDGDGGGSGIKKLS
ncbi:uncharacterized protein LOC119292159 [Triticum dicoccoides]|uniref:uncharacterized protein LOC119292159 n=1 Tax=Triticum dicoccoides TaxID=85692 RepID=UPI00188F31BE|nr:uncharacterized protein LOC119292159 [Triticum dicoccoides]XP_037426889.1 uncharacterized protein LOC119292159 [Triticum dicoccoides]